MFAMLPSPSTKPQSSSASPRLQGNLWKWTNYLSGWQQRWFVLDAGILAYYLAPSEVNQGCRGSLKVASCDIHVHSSDHTRLDIVMPGGRHIYLKASSTVERQQWVVALGTSKQDEEGTMEKLLGPSLDQQMAVKSKMGELRLSCQLLASQVSNMRNAASSASPDTENLSEMASLITKSCDSFLKILSECMLISTSSIRGGGGEGVIVYPPETPTDMSSPTSSVIPPLSSSGKHAEVTPSRFSFSEKPPVSLPSSTLPPLLPYPTPSNERRKHTASQKATEHSTQSLPIHVLGTPRAPPSSAQPANTANSTDATQRGTHLLQERKGQTENCNLPLEQDTTSSPRTHSRANSELYLTPTSTPTTSPPPSPSPTHSSPQHTSLRNSHTPPKEAEIKQVSPPTSQPQRIGDRFPRSSTSSEFQSFFSKVPHKFEDLVLSADDGIPTIAFLDSCRAVIPFFDTLSSTAFAPVKADINGNIEKLSQKYLSSPEQFPTLQSIVLHELHTNTHEAKNSSTDALLWLKRAMEFIQVFISEVAGGEHSLDIAAGKAYTKSLRKYHNWIVRGIFSVAVRAVPYHKDFLILLGSDGTADSNAAVTVHMADFSRSLGEINNIINHFYQLHKLDNTPL